jgi:hypothetical protein
LYYFLRYRSVKIIVRKFSGLLPAKALPYIASDAADTVEINESAI